MKDNNVNWEYLAPIAEIGKFCTNTDLKELSSVNRFFRSNLQSFVVKKIKLFGYGCKLHKELNIEPDSDNKKELTAQYTVNLLASKRYLVRHVDIYDGYSSSIANLLFGKFVNLTVLNIKCINKNLSNEDLFNTLKNLKYLEHFEYVDECRKYNYSGIDHLNYKLPLSLKSLCIYPFGRNPVEFRPFESLDSNYVNLTRLTVFNGRMLDSLNFQLKSLKYVNFVGSLETNSQNIEQLIDNNPQLLEISICSNQLNLTTINSILSLQKLGFLSIDYATSHDQNLPVQNLIQNLSIEHLQIHSLLLSNSILPILNSLSALKKLEIKSFNYTKFSLTNWSLLNIEIDKLLLNPSFNSDHYTKRSVNLAKFNSIRFLDEFELFYFQLSSNLNLNNWNIITQNDFFTFYWLVNNLQT